MPDDLPTMIAKAKAKLDDDEAHKALVERLAQKLYEARIDPETYEAMTGKERPAWRHPGGLPWDKYPELEIAEHERDDYRWQAIKLLEDSDLSITVT